MRNWTSIYRVRSTCYSCGWNTQSAYMRVDNTSGVQKELVDLRGWLSPLVHGELLAAALKLQSAKGSHNPKLNPRLKLPLHGTCICQTKLCKVPYICSSCETWMSKQIFSSPIALYVPHKMRRKNNTKHFKQPSIFRQSSFLFKVHLEIYSCVPSQRLFLWHFC